MKERKFVIDQQGAGQRLDKFLAEENDDLSRNYLQQLIAEEKVTVNQSVKQKSYQLKEEDKIKLTVPEAQKLEDVEPEAIPLDIIYEDEDLLVVNKQPDLVVHPAPGHPDGTLVNGLLHHCDNLSGINGVIRPGIVHRLDKDTSGAIVVAKNDQAHVELARQFKEREVTKEYLALVQGQLPHKKGKIDAAIGRNPNDRKKMAVTSKNSKRAVSRFEIVERFNSYTLVKVKLETGRTHQIRVHMEYINHPLVGDQLYGYRDDNLNPERQMLHAQTLGFTHPQTGEYREWEALLLADMKQLIKGLKEEKN